MSPWEVAKRPGPASSKELPKRVVLGLGDFGVAPRRVFHGGTRTMGPNFAGTLSVFGALRLSDEAEVGTRSL